ncbi:hypothetical protein EF879_00100 [Micromonospora sp. HM5-17]|nr:hypothetical protein EF879_00100 [Micromonospora sp. HM5-17]
MSSLWLGLHLPMVLSEPTVSTGTCDAVVGWPLAGDAACHAGDGGPADEGFGDGGVAFVVAVLPGCGEHAPGDQQAQSVGDDEPLSAVDRLARVVAPGCPGRRCPRLDRRGVGDPSPMAPAGGPAAHPGLDPACGRQSPRHPRLSRTGVTYQYTVYRDGQVPAGTATGTRTASRTGSR